MPLYKQMDPLGYFGAYTVDAFEYCALWPCPIYVQNEYNLSKRKSPFLFHASEQHSTCETRVTGVGHVFRPVAGVSDTRGRRHDLPAPIGRTTGIPRRVCPTLSGRSSCVLYAHQAHSPARLCSLVRVACMSTLKISTSAILTFKVIRSGSKAALGFTTRDVRFVPMGTLAIVPYGNGRFTFLNTVMFRLTTSGSTLSLATKSLLLKNSTKCEAVSGHRKLETFSPALVTDIAYAAHGVVAPDPLSQSLVAIVSMSRGVRCMSQLMSTRCHKIATPLYVI
jgi:hypothetical protein